MVGFDCEWVTVNNQRRKIALIQLCSAEGLCALIRICKFTTIPLQLRALLEDPEIIKAGVTPSNDANYLLQDYAIKMNGTFDLRFLALIADHKSEGLGKLSKSILDIELDKDWRIRCSDWEIEKLSPKQIDYAAKDAFVGVEIFRRLYKSVHPTAMKPEEIRSFCDNYTDIAFKNKMIQNGLPTASGRKLLTRQNEIVKFPTRSYTSRTKPLYDNCQLEAPDGELLCSCDRKKAEWYVNKGRGVVVQTEPVYTVRLTFEPAGRAVGETGEYYRTVRENLCVVCGKENNLIRKNVVPHEYRKFFPTVMKDKTSHDILLLCIHCHQLSNITDLKMRQMLQATCDAPLIGEILPEDVEAANKLRREQRQANALYQSKQLIPEWRKAELKENLQKAYPDDEINDSFLENLLSKEVALSRNLAASHGEMVVKKFRETEGLVHLEKLWRNHFLNSMNPKHMPTHWDVNHNGSRLEIRASEGRVNEEELKIAGVEAIIVPKAAPIVTVTSPDFKDKPSSSFIIDEKPSGSSITNNEDDVDSSSDCDFRSAAGSRNSSAKGDLDRTLIEDDRYFSDATSMRSFYETIRSDGSTLDDFQSFASSLTERPLYDSDGSRTSLCSQDLSIDSDTEIEDENPVGKMEL